MNTDIKDAIDFIKRVRTDFSDDAMCKELGMKTRRFKQLKYVVTAGSIEYATDFDKSVLDDLSESKLTINKAYILIKEDEKPKVLPEHKDLVKAAENIIYKLRRFHTEIKPKKIGQTSFAVNQYDLRPADDIDKELSSLIRLTTDAQKHLRTVAESVAQKHIDLDREENREWIEQKETRLRDKLPESMFDTDANRKSSLKNCYYREAMFDHQDMSRAKRESEERLSTFVLTLQQQ